MYVPSLDGMCIISRWIYQLKVGVYQKLRLATSQTQFGLTLNLLDNFCPQFALNLKSLGKILVKFPVKSQKFTKNVDVIIGQTTSSPSSSIVIIWKPPPPYYM